MQTDVKPTARGLAREFDASDAKRIRMPGSRRLAPGVAALAAAVMAESLRQLKGACEEFVEVLSRFYKVRAPKLRLLGPRPHRSFEGILLYELFGDYHLKEHRIRLWTRTPRRKQWTSQGVILSTLCHEFMHHLDVVSLKFPHSPHTVGFYERCHKLYLAATGHPYYPLSWYGDSYPVKPRTINWPETRQNKLNALAKSKTP